MVIFAFLIRLIPLFSINTNGRIMFIGTDPFYHVRRVVYTVNHFPDTITFDSYINYPYGYEIGWPPLYDQLIAGLALIVGGGNPDTATIEMVAAIFPVILGALTIIPVYYAASSIFDKKTAVISAAIISLIPAHLMVSGAGSTDHHAAEVLLSTTAFALFLLALKYSRETELSFSKIKEADKKNLIKPVLFSAASGLVLTLTIFTWIGAPIFLGLLLIYSFVQYTFDLKEKRQSHYVLFSVLLTYISILLLMTPLIIMGLRPGLEMSGMFLSTFQVVFVVALIAASLASGLIAEAFGKKELQWTYYPVLIIITAIVGLVLVNLIAPGFYSQAIQGINYLSGTGVLETITEAQPLLFDTTFTTSHVWSAFTVFSLTAIIGLVIGAADLHKKKYPAEMVFFITWTLVVLVLTLSQRRFAYMLSINFALLSAYFIDMLYAMWKQDQEEEKNTKRRTKKKPQKTPIWEKAASGAIILLFVVIIGIFAISPLSNVLSSPNTPSEDWQESLTWLESNSPETSYFLEPDQTPEYGVMSWWDYGNWIIYIAKRPAVANNFQTGLEDAATFYVTSNEKKAKSILEKRNARYVITDTWVTTGKLQYIYEIAGEEFLGAKQYEDFVWGEESIRPSIIKLHLFNGNKIDYLRLIHESEGAALKVNFDNSTGNSTEVSNIKIFEYVPGATIYGVAGSNEPVSASTNVTLDSGRTFEYQIQAIANKSGWYELTVPYSTNDTPYGSVVEPYYITDGNATEQLNVDENDVIKGNRIRLDISNQ
ncbi:MAG: oligosaccharyl transferase, archaeosortase A system-associated [Methanolobus sp.]